MTMGDVPVATFGELRLYETSPGRFSIRDDYSGRTLTRNLGPEKTMRVWGKITSGQVDLDELQAGQRGLGTRESGESLAPGRLGRYRRYLTQKERLLSEIEALAKGGFKGRSMTEELRGSQEEV